MPTYAPSDASATIGVMAPPPEEPTEPVDGTRPVTCGPGTVLDPATGKCVPEKKEERRPPGIEEPEAFALEPWMVAAGIGLVGLLFLSRGR